ncbi:MAG: hypothetical protein V1788_00950 [Nanoarchaeota archaeon]
MMIFVGCSRVAELIDTEARCLDFGGKWEAQEIKCVTTPCPQGYCNRDYQCRMDYEDAQKKYSLNAFLIAVPLGILIIIFGAFLFSLDAVGVGLMGGGVGTMIYGIGGYWNYADNWLRFIISLIGLVALIFFTYWFNNKIEKKR